MHARYVGQHFVFNYILFKWRTCFIELQNVSPVKCGIVASFNLNLIRLPFSLSWTQDDLMNFNFRLNRNVDNDIEGRPAVAEPYE